MGGATTEVRPTTVDVLFEAAHWDPVMVARTAPAAQAAQRGVQALRARRRPASWRWPAIERAVRLLAEYGGGTAGDEVLDFDTRPRRAAGDHRRRPAGAGGRRGRTPPGRVADLLTRDRLRRRGRRRRGSSVTPPTWRPDLTDPADLAEEVIRLDGYDKVPSVLPIAPPGNGLTATQRRRRAVGRALAEAGLRRGADLPVRRRRRAGRARAAADDPRRHAVRLRNPLSEEEPALRTTLLPPLLAALRRNLGRGQRDVALYEIGLVFHPAAAPAPPPVLGVDAPARRRRARGGRDARAATSRGTSPRCSPATSSRPAGGAPGRPATWADAVEAARAWWPPRPAPTWTVRGRRAARRGTRAGARELLVGGAVVGYAGELHPAACAALDLPPRTCAMELDLDALPLPGVDRRAGDLDVPAGADRRGAGRRRGDAGRRGARRR